jgi:hypothetical protein
LETKPSRAPIKGLEKIAPKSATLETRPPPPTLNQGEWTIGKTV